MKKVILMLAVAFSMTMFSCANKNAENAAEETPAVVEEEVVAAPVEEVATEATEEVATEGTEAAATEAPAENAEAAAPAAN